MDASLWSLLPAWGWLLLGAGIGAIVAALVTWILGNRRAQSLQQALHKTEALLDSREQMLEQREADHTRIKDVFGSVSHEALQKNARQFLQLAEERLKRQSESANSSLKQRQEAINHMLRPIADTMKRTEAHLQKIEKERVTHHGALSGQLKDLLAEQRVLQKSTQQLRNALQNPKFQGNWGEFTLKRLVELAGMTAQVDFDVQVTGEGEHNRARPDMKIQLPDQRCLIVDAKAPLDAYVSAQAADNDQERKRLLTEHARNMRRQVKELARKDYWSQFADSPDFIILFVPGEAFLSAAMQEDPGLFEDALRTHIILATPTSLIAILRAVAFSWRQLALIENARELRAIGETFQERLATFLEHLSALGTKLGGAVKSYNDAVGSLRKRLQPTAAKLAESGIKSKKELEMPDPVDQQPRELEDD